MKRTHMAMGLVLGLLVSNVSFGALVAHFDGTQIETTAGKVDTWTNQGIGGDAQALGGVTANPDAVSTVMPNGTTHTVVDFDGVYNHLTMGSDTNLYDGSSFTWIIVFKNGDTNQNGKALLANTYAYTYGGTVTDGNNPVWQTFANSGNNIYVSTRSSSGSFRGNSTGSGTPDEWSVVTGRWDGDEDRIYIYLNGSPVGVRDLAAAEPTGHVRTRIGAGSSGTAGNFFNGQIAEIRIYNESLSDAARSAIEEELMGKYIVADLSLVAHYDGTQITTINGNEVARWNNQGIGGDAYDWGGDGTRPAAIPVVMPNGTTHTVVDFDGVDDHLTIGSDSGNYDTNAFTWIILYKPDVDQNSKNLLMNAYTETSPGETSNANAVWGTFMNSGYNTYALGRTSTGGFKGVSTGATDSDWHIMSAKWDGSSRLYAWLDTNYLGQASSVDADPSGHLRTRIGSNANGAADQFFNGQIAEIRIYNRALSDAERLADETELLDKYFNVIAPGNYYDGWIASYGLSGVDALMDEDPDGDLMLNLGEYAFGGDPTNSNDIGYVLPFDEMVVDGGSNWLQYVYARQIDSVAHGLVYLPETATDLVLADWTTNSGAVTIGTGILDDDFLLVTSRVSTVEDAKFMRVRVDFQE